MNTTPPAFIFLTCQVHAETALKQEIARDWPDLRFAYSRPGFVTFKLPPDTHISDDIDLHSVFARTCACSLGKARGASPDELAKSVWQLADDRPIEQVHVWQRDLAPPGLNDLEPGMTPLASMVELAVLNAAPAGLAELTAGRTSKTSRPLVLDCVVVETGEWWVGVHRVNSVASSWPGGFMPGDLPAEAVSRGYLKMQEALLWSELPVCPGERCVEIGSAPGGATQLLLERGLQVTGIDPAAMHPTVIRHPRFTHIRDRAKDVPRDRFLHADWLVVDINLSPNYTLDSVEAILGHPGVHLRGVLMTLKLGEWSLAAEVPEYLERIRSWGLPDVRARQLHHNRQEICVVAAQTFGDPA